MGDSGPVAPAGEPSVGGAGGSATAVVGLGWLGGGAAGGSVAAPSMGPPCRSSVKGLRSPVSSCSPDKPTAWVSPRPFVLSKVRGGSAAVPPSSAGLAPGSSAVLPEGRESLAQPPPWLQSPTVPELPDLAVLAEGLHAALAGRRLRGLRVRTPLTVRAAPGELDALVGQRLLALRRRGKFLRFAFERDEIVVNLMRSGRLALATDDTERPAAAVSLDFTARDEQPPTASWVVGASWLPAPTATPRLSLLDRQQMAKLYVVSPEGPRVVPGLEPDALGPDADDPELTLEAWRERIRRHRGQLKPLLRNQRFVAGIGNAYADEILHAARLLPFRQRSSLAAEEIDDLYVALRRTLAAAIEVLRQRVPPTFERQVRDFFAVHGRAGLPCPRCGSRISEIGPGEERTAYCRGCQH